MELSCIKIVNYFFLSFNLVGFIFGTLVFGYGIQFLTNKTPIRTVVQNSVPSYEVGIYVFTAVGAITMLMGIWGCLGFIYGMKRLLSWYIYFLALIITIHVVNIIFHSSQEDLVKQKAIKTIFHLMEDYNPADENNQALENTWDHVQSQFNCCGFIGPHDWKHNIILWMKNYTSYPCSCRNGTTVPKGFCSLKIPPPVASSIEEWPVMQAGCVKVLQDWMYEQFIIIFTLSIVVVVIEFFGMVIFLCLKKCILKLGRF